jgi:hypothetical protein
MTVSAMGFEDATFVVIKKTIKTKPFERDATAYTGMVDLAVSTALSAEEKKAGLTYPIVTQRIFFSLNEEESYRFSVPFAASNLLILMQAEAERITLKVKVE